MIVAIGGGDQRAGETAQLDAFVVRASGSSSPRVLFLATATRDAESYTQSFARHMTALGAEVRSLALTTNPRLKVVHEALAWAQVIYAGGGDANLLYKTWNRFSLRPLLVEAQNRGVVLAGVSAGALCWFEGGRAAYNGYKALPGMGLASGTVVPHYTFGVVEGLLPVGSGPVFGVSDRAALVCEDGVYSALVETPEAGVWRLDPSPVRLPNYAPSPRGENAAETR